MIWSFINYEYYKLIIIYNNYLVVFSIMSLIEL